MQTQTRKENVGPVGTKRHPFPCPPPINGTENVGQSFERVWKVAVATDVSRWKAPDLRTASADSLQWLQSGIAGRTQALLPPAAVNPPPR